MESICRLPKRRPESWELRVRIAAAARRPGCSRGPCARPAGTTRLAPAVNVGAMVTPVRQVQVVANSIRRDDKDAVGMEAGTRTCCGSST